MERILIVEDDFDIQELLQNFLQEAGYQAAVAKDGVEAVSMFSKERFDLILLDIMLPKIDGFTVCELIRRQSQIPIIMLTALRGAAARGRRKGTIRLCTGTLSWIWTAIWLRWTAGSMS